MNLVRTAMIRMGIVGVLLTVAGAQVSPPVRSIAVQHFSMNDRSMNILANIAVKYKITLGLFGILVGSDSSKINISIEQGTLDDVLNALSAADTRFEWKQDQNGAVHVTTRQSQLALFDVPVSSVDMDNLDRTETIAHLNRIPEVASWLAARQCWMDELTVGHQPRDRAKISVHMRDKPLSWVLDEVAGKSGTYFWSAVQYSVKPCAINLKP